ncbi:glycosyltransferase family 4 protein [Listeria booriae]|uniref:Glycosyltransferase family 4 protein n=1 Tax=Listeria booriae TaxID=1552123 RepID=A0A841YSX9_9LIST|nr:glycosyltransferase [Listeria booriae]MBC1402847.1 glycosyltransferase family 4 protein [Listeria booriae]MBC1617621.1 glycosyltransferase family 4 protein [Listeria booriae]
MKNKALNKKKVFVYSSVHVWNDTRIYYKEIETLLKADYQVEQMAVETMQQPEPRQNLTQNLFEKGSRLKRFARWFTIYKAIRRSDAKYYHFHDPELLLLLPILRKRDGIFIYDMHENFPKALETKAWIPKRLRKPLAKIVKRVEQKGLALCNSVIFAESSYKKDYPYVTQKQEDILNYPIYQEVIQSRENEEQILLYVGGIEENRGLWIMLEALRSLKHLGHEKLKLKLVGPVSEADNEKIDTFVTEHSLASNVERLGRIPNVEINRHMATATIGLCLLKPIPNYMESMATKMFEYMSAELPMIVSDFPMWSDLMKETKSGLSLNPLDTEEVTEAIELLLENKILRQKMGANGRRHYEKTYNWTEEGEKLLALYESANNEVLNESPIYQSTF